MKKSKRIITYFVSFIIPVIIFLLCTILNNTYPFGKYPLDILDSQVQYGPIMLAIKRGFLNGNFFFSWGGGLGFNLFSNIIYYAGSILNFGVLFIKDNMYYHYTAIMMIIRFGLLGLSMSIYLNYKKLKPLHNIMLSICYAFMGFVSIYYYTFMWMDSIIMLPIVILGLEKLLDEDKPLVYIVSLILSIYMNVYVGYMICIFCLIFFAYKLLINNKNAKRKIKSFIISSILAGMSCSLFLLPSVVALSRGHSEATNYLLNTLFTTNALTFIPNMFPFIGSTSSWYDSRAQIYISIFAFLNIILYFFNHKFTKREKIVTASFIGLFYIIFAIRPLTNIFHLFENPNGWGPRFAFIFCFFALYIASQNLLHIKDLKINKNIVKILIGLLILSSFLPIVLFLLSNEEAVRSPLPLAFAFIFLAIYLIILLISKKRKYLYLMIFLILELFLNTSYNVYQNTKIAQKSLYVYNEERLKVLQDKIDNLDNSFYRMDFEHMLFDNDGLYFNYNGINFLSSTINKNVRDLFVKLGMPKEFFLRIRYENMDYPVMSLFNIKYLIDNYDNIKDTDYYLPFAFVVSNKIKYVSLNNKYYGDNINAIYSGLVGRNVKIYTTIDYNDFAYEGNTYTYNFVSDFNGKISLNYNNYHLNINGKASTRNSKIAKGDNVSITYYLNNYNVKDLYFVIFDQDEWNRVYNELLNKDFVYNIETNKDGHIFEGTINVNLDNSFIYTSIPYEKGMRVYIDGKEIRPNIILDSLLGFNVNKGIHTITIDYTPRGIKSGAIITIISLSLTAVYLITKKKSQ